MNLNSVNADRSSAPQTAPAANGGGESFQLAYARVNDGRYAPATPEVAPERAPSTPRMPQAVESKPDLSRPAKSAHTVHAGETLTGIARARLAALGATADTLALRESIAQIAKANNIRNPDRIYVGQKIDLAGLDAAFSRQQAAASVPSVVAVRETAAPLASSARFNADFDMPLQSRWHDDEFTIADVEPEVTTRPAALPVALPPFPPADASAGIDIPATAQMPAIDQMAARQIALYTQNAAPAAEKPAALTGALSDIMQKGVAGKVLDALPIEPSTRANLQRANTIVSSAFTARSLGALTGLGGPILTVAGLLWGVFSSRQSEAASTTEAKPATNTTPVADARPAAQTRVADAQN